MLTALQESILAAVDKLAEGEVVSFGDVAARAGHPTAARAAGSALACAGDTYPWWRVVYSDAHLPNATPACKLNDWPARAFTGKVFASSRPHLVDSPTREQAICARVGAV